jgi:hypothetical protein
MEVAPKKLLYLTTPPLEVDYCDCTSIFVVTTSTTMVANSTTIKVAQQCGLLAKQ